MPAPTFEAPRDYATRISERHDVQEEKAKRFASFKQDFITEFERGMDNTKLVAQLESADWTNLTVAQVLSIQTLLYRLGFNDRANIDGAYAKKAQKNLRRPEDIKKEPPEGGSQTQRAVLAFQEKFRLEQDGQFGPQSFAKLKEVLSTIDTAAEAEVPPRLTAADFSGQFIDTFGLDGNGRIQLKHKNGEKFVFVERDGKLYPVEKGSSPVTRFDMPGWVRNAQGKFDFWDYYTRVNDLKFKWNRP